MSFSSDVKNECSRLDAPKKCCMLAEIAGFIRLSGTLGLAGGGKYFLKLTTEDPAICRLFLRRMKDYFGASSTLHVEENAPLKKGRIYELTIGPEEGSEMILRETGILLVREGSNFFSEEVPETLVKKKCDKKAFLRGVFLGGGSVTAPTKNYHLDMSCGSEALADDVKRVVNSFGLRAKVIRRRNKYVVYLKESEQICDFLSIVGADTARLAYENVRIVKDQKNRTNRIANFENANMDRAAENAAKQLEAIRLIEEKLGTDNLKPALRSALELRKNHPEASLAELADLSDPPVSRSGLNSRLKKLEELGNSLR